ncbi:MAG: tetratricopeptide repeat protein [Leptospiraceae bacterium]|nr:tetratricopeptide repeat protein [Leptospiraceae bacterium]
MITPQMKELLEYYNSGLQKYKEAKFQEALELFQKALSIIPDDGPSIEYSKRCKEFIQDPPPIDWDGVYVMKTK